MFRFSTFSVLFLTLLSFSSCTELSTIKAPDLASYNQFGTSISVSGNLVVVGAFQATAGGYFQQGTAYLYDCSSYPCQQIDKLNPLDGGSNYRFGQSVSISGSLVVVGAYQSKVGSVTNQGAAYVYECSSLPCQQVDKLIANDGAANSRFGFSVSIEGKLVVVGAYQTKINSNNNQGAVYIYDCSTYPCQQMDKMTAKDGAGNDAFGYSVSISGKLVAVGTPQYSNPYYLQGAAYIFDCSSFPCVQKDKLVAFDGVGSERFGYSISISGNLVALGAYLAQIGSVSNQGAAYVFDCSSYPCQQKSKLTASDGLSNDRLGTSVSISGSIVVSGAPFVKIGSVSYQGAAYIFDCSSFPCQQKGKIFASDGYGNTYFGTSVSINGERIAAGATQGDTKQQGEAYLFDICSCGNGAICKNFSCSCPNDSGFPKTSAGQTVTLTNCPGNQYGQKSKSCDSNGVWSPINGGCYPCPTGTISPPRTLDISGCVNPCSINNGGCASGTACTIVPPGKVACLCPADSGFPQTAGGQTVTLKNCPSNQYGTTSRSCDSNLVWGSITNNCQSCPVGTSSPANTLDISGCVNIPCSINNGGCSISATCSNNGGVASCYCPANSGFPKTLAGQTSTIASCPGNQYGQRTRTCDSIGNWGTINSFCYPCPSGTISPSRTLDISGCVNPCLTNNGGCASGSVCTIVKPGVVACV